MSEGPEELEVTTPAGKFRARGYDLLVIVVVLICTINSAILYTHMEDAKATGQAIVQTNKEVGNAIRDASREQAKAIQESNRVQRLSACLNATKEEQKEKEYMQPNSFCNRMAQ